MSLYKSAVKRPITTALCFVAIAIFGIFSLVQLSIDLFPNIEGNSIMVMTTYSGASASDIETNISKPLENTLNSVSHLKHITSFSRENASVVNLEFEYGTDLDVATNDVRDKLGMITTLPDEANAPILFKFGTEDIPIMMLSVSAKESMPGLYKMLDEYVTTPLARVSGVGQVSVSGIAQREIQVYCDPQKLDAYGLTIEGISSTIAAENRNVPAGNIDIGSNTYSLRVQQEFNGVNELYNLVVGTSNGASIYLKDVASISDTQEEKYQESYTNGKLSGRIVIQKQAGANSNDIADKIHEILPQLQKSLPSDVEITQIFDTSENIKNTISSLEQTIAIILIVVMIIVFLFLERWRATFVVVLTIPISLLGALVYLLITGETLNILSMSALSIAIGMVVDNAIVVLENITTHIDRGSRPKQAAVFATNEVAVSVIASTLTTVAVFFPLTFVSGMAGILFKPIGWMVSIILVISTVAALSLTPMLSSQLLKSNPYKGKFQTMIFKPIEWFLNSLSIWYAKGLNWVVRHRTVTLIGALAIFVAVMVLIAPQVKSEYFPTQDNGRASISIELPVGTRQEITRDLALRIDSAFHKDYPELTVLNFTEGTAAEDNIFASLSNNGSNIISMNVNFGRVEDRRRGLVELCQLMRKDLDEYPEIRTYQVIAGGNQGGTGGQAAADIEIYGYDFDATDKLAEEVRQAMLKLPGCAEVNISRDQYTPEYQVVFDREKLAINGLNVTTAATYLRNRVNGSVTSYFREDGDEYEIRVRYDKKFRQSIEDIENITIYNSLGKGVKIRDLGKIVEAQTPPTIERKDRQRIVTASAVVAPGYALSDMVQAAQAEMAKIDIPDGITWRIGGTYEDQQDTFKDLITLIVLMIILVYIVMAAQFESMTYPFVIMFSFPFALVGVIFGLWVTGTPLGVMAMLGVLMLLGIVVNNGIVLIDYIRLQRDRGMNIIQAVTTSGKSRLRPILMTTLTTVFGMVPLAIGTGTGSEMWRSLGMTVAWGLSFSTLITLFLIPTLYCVFAGNGVKRKRKSSLKLRRKQSK